MMALVGRLSVRVLTLLLGLLVILSQGLLTPTATALATDGQAAPALNYAQTFAYDTPINNQPANSTAPERGPPTHSALSIVSAGQDAVDHGLHGTLARPSRGTISTYGTYDVPVPLTQVDNATATTGVPARALGGDLSSLESSATAAESGIGIDESINTAVSAQRQARHILDSPLYNGGGYFKGTSDAQRVLDAYHSGDASILRTTSNGNVIVRYQGVTGYNNNPGAGYLDQPTDVFMIKGTNSVSVVPFSPGG